jgi:hypothetical protein
MAIGDVAQKKLLAKALTITNTDSSVTGAATKLTTITSITLANLNTTTARTVTIYGYGTAAGNTVAIITIPALGTEILTGLDYVLAAGESYYFKQDTGTDVNATVMGIEEVVS